MVKANQAISHLSRISTLIGLQVIIKLNLTYIESSFLYTTIVIEINLINKIRKSADWKNQLKRISGLIQNQWAG